MTQGKKQALCLQEQPIWSCWQSSFFSASTEGNIRCFHKLAQKMWRYVFTTRVNRTTMARAFAPNMAFYLCLATLVYLCLITIQPAFQIWIESHLHATGRLQSAMLIAVATLEKKEMPKKWFKMETIWRNSFHKINNHRRGLKRKQIPWRGSPCEQYFARAFDYLWHFTTPQLDFILIDRRGVKFKFRIKIYSGY